MTAASVLDLLQQVAEACAASMGVPLWARHTCRSVEASDTKRKRVLRNMLVTSLTSRLFSFLKQNALV